jgi:hypothetical protein
MTRWVSVVHGILVFPFTFPHSKRPRTGLEIFVPSAKWCWSPSALMPLWVSGCCDGEGETTVPDFGIPLDVGNPMATLGAPLALVALILMGSRISRANNGESRDIGGMVLIVLIIAVGFFWVFEAVGVMERF